MKHFLAISDLSPAEVQDLLDVALKLKKEYFKKELNDLIAANNSPTEGLSILFEIVEYLEFLKGCYYVLTIQDENPFWADSNKKDVDYHKNVKIIPNEKNKYNKSDIFIQYVVSKFISDHKIAVDHTISQVKNLITIVEKADGTNQIRKINKNYDIIWNRTDTDLLELITALLESRSINNSNGNLSRKEAIDLFTVIFNIPIKDPESKLTRATNRKKDVSPYLSSLKEAFDNYAVRKEERLDEIRGY